MMRHAALCALVLSVTASAFGFNGDGAKLFQQGKDALRAAARAKGGGADEGDAVDQYEKAADLFKESLALATNPRESVVIKRALVSAFNDIAIELHARRDLTRAVEAARNAIDYADDGSAVLQSNMASMYFEAGDYYNAAVGWERAKELAGQTPLRESSSRNLITAYIRDGQSRDRGSLGLAVRELEDVLSSKPEDKEMLLLLGRTYQLQGDSVRALEAWERARHLGGLDGDAERAYQQLKASVALKRGFTRSETRHFNIDFNDKAHASLAGRLLELFEEAHEELSHNLGLSTEGAGRVTVTVYTDGQFDRAVRVAWAGGIQQANRVDLRVNPKWGDKDYEDTVRHEYCHYLAALKALNKPIPAWFQEGFAMHQEKALDQPYFKRRLFRGRAKGLFLPLAALEQSFSALPSDRVALAYAESYDFVGFLLERSGVPAFARYLDSVGEGAKLETAFESSFSFSPADAERSWLGSVDERQEPFFAEEAKAAARSAAAAATVPRTGTAAGRAATPGRAAAPPRAVAPRPSPPRQ
ncbi:MAG: hypothetical protein HY303_19590 [Candidatus Wallbacteria bacterium]|nr:hypothetical protein [Candidatus Wallbacteria bacterium]